MMLEVRKDIINRLQKDILLWQGFKPQQANVKEVVGLGLIEEAFPNGVFPKGAIHEFLCEEPEQAAAGSSFITGLVSSLMDKGGACIWISTSRILFPLSLNAFGVEPERMIFVDVQREKDVLWVMEEALKCEGLAGVIAELNELSFTQSRRLQLAVEHSKVTGFIIRKNERKLNSTTCVARWKITPVPSELSDGLPGVGFPRWQVELLRVRNGNPGTWQLEWIDGKFVPVNENVVSIDLHERKAV